MKIIVEDPSVSDSELVALCLRNDRHAFGAIVARYPSAVCGIAYSACGDVGRSEDLAQDTFGTLKALANYVVWINLLWILPLIAWWRAIVEQARRTQKNTAGNGRRVAVNPRCGTLRGENRTGGGLKLP